jgi:hypothetical protein
MPVAMPAVEATALLAQISVNQQGVLSQQIDEYAHLCGRVVEVTHAQLCGTRMLLDLSHAPLRAVVTHLTVAGLLHVQDGASQPMCVVHYLNAPKCLEHALSNNVPISACRLLPSWWQRLRAWLASPCMGAPGAENESL